MNLWIIGGTSESRQLVQALCNQATGTVVPELCLVVTVTTESARSLYPTRAGVSVWVGKLTDRTINEFMGTHRVGAILDLSHPFAEQISRLAIATAERFGVPYLRYERQRVSPKGDWHDLRGRLGCLELPQLADVLTPALLCHERTLLTMGYRYLPHFAPWQSAGTLFARILPSQTALQVAYESGFTSDRIIALRPPISPALEAALWQQWQITQVVTKASGSAGGQGHKYAVAAQLGVRLIQISRPAIAYPKQTECFDTALKYASRYGVKVTTQ